MQSPAFRFQKVLAEGTTQGVEDAAWPPVAAHDASHVMDGAVHRPGSWAAVMYERVQATTGSGGWPMSAFLTPDLQPFYGGALGPAPGMVQPQSCLPCFGSFRHNCMVCVECRMLPRHHVREPHAAMLCLHVVALHAFLSRKLLHRGKSSFGNMQCPAVYMLAGHTHGLSVHPIQSPNSIKLGLCRHLLPAKGRVWTARLPHRAEESCGGGRNSVA